MSWLQTHGPDIELSSRHVLNPNFIAPNVDNKQRIQLELNARDQFGIKYSDKITIIVLPLTDNGDAFSKNSQKTLMPDVHTPKSSMKNSNQGFSKYEENHSDSSNARLDRTPPQTVLSLSVKPMSDTHINLEWSPNSEKDFDHYNIYRGTSSNFVVNLRTTPPTAISTTNSYSNTGLSLSTKYYYKVAAVDSAGNIGALSSEKRAIASVVRDTIAPVIVSTTPNNGETAVPLASKVTVTFNEPISSSSITSSTFTLKVTGSHTYVTGTRSLSGSDGYKTAVFLPSLKLSPATNYVATISRAIKDQAGNPLASSKMWSFTTASAQSDTKPPAQVTGLTVTTGNSSHLVLTWSKNLESDFSYYNVYRGVSGGFTVIPGTTPPTAISTTNSYSNTGLSPSTKYYYKVAAVDSAGNIGALSSEKFGTTSSISSNAYDNFEGGTYTLADGMKSPNGKWASKWAGYGKVGVKTENSNNIFFEFPKSSTKSSETHSSLVTSTQKYSNFVLELDMKTNIQLRQNTPPNTWEAGWVMWRWADLFHHYYFVLKTNGFEFGKKDNNCNCEEQVFLKTGNSPKVEMGTWAHVKISSVGKHNTVWVNGVKIVDMDDATYSGSQMSTGSVGLYNEDASVAFDNVFITQQ